MEVLCRKFGSCSLVAVLSRWLTRVPGTYAWGLDEQRSNVSESSAAFLQDMTYNKMKRYFIGSENIVTKSIFSISRSI